MKKTPGSVCSAPGMGQQIMDKPPTKAKPSAEAEETPDDRRARLLQLAADYFSAVRREPNEESLEMWQLLLAIGSSPDRRRKLAQYERQLAGKAARTDPKHPDKFWRTVWVRLIPDLVAAEENDSEVARLLIGVLPAWLQAKCPKYPTNEAKLEAAVAAVIAEENFVPELCKCRGGRALEPLARGSRCSSWPWYDQGRREEPSSDGPMGSVAPRARRTLGRWFRVRA